MKYLLLQLQKNWEMAVLIVTAALLLCILVPFFLIGRDVEEVMGSGKAALKRESALSAEAFAFLNQEENGAELERNPFKLKLKAPEPPKPKPSPKKEEPKVVEKPKPKPVEPPPEPKQDKVEQPPQPQVAFQFVPGVILFTFQQMNSTGKTVAIISAQSKGTQAQTYTLGVGEEVNGATVLAISDEALLVRDARNRRITIPLGSKKQLWMKTKVEKQ